MVYKKVPGQSLRDLITHCEAHPFVLGDFEALLAHLHRQGFYFRSIHFGNVILLPTKELALIGLADLRGRLGANSRLGNFRHFLRNGKDAVAIKQVDVHRFLERDVSESLLSPWAAHRVLKRVKPLITAIT